MTTFTVTTNADTVDAGDGVLSLREALALADATEAADTIRFASAVQGQTIVLAGSQLTVNSDVIIDGGRGIILDADERSRVLEVQRGGTDATLAHLTVTGGKVSADDVGGGIFVTLTGTLSLVHTTVTGNSAGGSGGGIFANRVTLANSTVSGNSAEGGVGGIQGESIFSPGNSFVSLIDSTVSGNSTEGHVGGIGAYAVALANSTVSGNSAGGDVGGIAGRTVTLANSTVSGNSAGGDGGGIRGGLALGGTVTLANSIIAGNSATGEAPDLLGSITSSNGHNIFGSDVAGNVPGDLENVPASLLFAAIDPTTGGGLLVDNGGPTQTIALRDSDDNLALGRADPADAAATDQRGEVRPAPEGTNPDIGAFELDQSAPSPPDPSPPIPSPAPPVNEIGGTTGADVLRGTAGADLIRGRPGGDTLWGFAGDDELFGGYGSDVLVGGPGLDRMTGGAGADRFVLRQPEAAPADGPAYDEILDFSRLQHDRIDLQPIDARSGAAGNQAFTFIGDDPFTRAGQLRFEATTDGDFLVSGSTDRDRDADFAFIVRTGLQQLFEGDFLL